MEPEHQVYKEHNIELRVRADGGMRDLRVEQESEFELLIDNNQVQYGQLPNGQYFLHGHAYDWRDNLMDLGRALIDFREKSEKIRREAEHKEN